MTSSVPFWSISSFSIILRPHSRTVRQTAEESTVDAHTRRMRALTPAMQTAPMAPFRKTADTFGAGPKSLPQKYFVSPEVFAKEQTEIFSKEWLFVGHQSQISKPGDY